MPGEMRMTMLRGFARVAEHGRLALALAGMLGLAAVSGIGACRSEPPEDEPIGATPSALSEEGLPYKQLVTGGQHSCALNNDGSVRCWGRNNFGQLGDGTTTDRTTPVTVSGLTHVIGLAAGFTHTCGLLDDGTAKCWGKNSSGQLGDGTTTSPRTTPVAVTTLSNATALSAPSSNNSTCALLADGTAKCWGAGGQLGDNTTTPSSTPVTVSSLSGAQAISGGGGGHCALLSDGRIKCWGANSAGQIGDNTTTPRYTPVFVSNIGGTDTPAIAVGKGNSHTCAVLSTGRIKCWGDNYAGQLGNDSTNPSYLPTFVNNIGNGGEEAIAVGAGLWHTCALLTTGSVQCWGYNNDGEVGDATTMERHTPVDVDVAYSNTSLAVGWMHTCAMGSWGGAQCWGDNSGGQLGDGSSGNYRTTTVDVSGLTGQGARPQISGGAYHSCGLLADGTVKCWGFNNHGQLGDGTTTNSLTPVSVVPLGQVIQISSGEWANCALLGDRSVKCWGWNSTGALGDNTTTERHSPVSVSGLYIDVVEVSSGNGFSCALSGHNGTVKCWGANSSGQLGDGTWTERHTAVPVSGLTGATRIASGKDHTCALMADGTVKCWGGNGNGCLGDNTTSNRNAPVSVTGLTGAIRISAGQYHTCALLSDGTAKCWGQNQYDGQLGDGTYTNHLTPYLAVSGLSGATHLVSGYDHTCALLSNGNAKCWGSGGYGQLGDNGWASHNSAVAVSSLTNVVGLGAGENHTCAILSDLTAKCWGYNVLGALGDGSTNDSGVPVPVSNFP